MNASESGLCAALAQRKPGFSEFVVAYASFDLTKVECKYSFAENKLLAIVLGIIKILSLCAWPSV